MAKINSASDSPNQNTLDGLRKFVNAFSNDVTQALNGGLTFQDNFACQLKEVTFAHSNTEQLIEHTLKKVPTGYLAIRADAVTNLYDGTTAWTNKLIYLRADVATTVTLLLF